MNVTAVTPRSNAFLTVYPDGAATPPSTSNVNYQHAITTATLSEVSVGYDSAIRVYNGGYTPVDVVVDLAAEITAGRTTDPGSVVAGPSTRLLDSRTTGVRLGAFQAQTIKFPAGGTLGVQLTLTVFHPQGSGYLAVLNAGAPRPSTSVLNFKAGAVVSNGALVASRPDRTVVLINESAGPLDLIVDYEGAALDDPTAAAYQQTAMHDGLAAGTALPLQLSLRWHLALGRPSYPVIAGGRLFVTSTDPTSPDPPDGQILQAFDVTTGSPLWGPVKLPGQLGHERLAYDNDRLFAGDGGGPVTAFDPATGQVVWTNRTASQGGMQDGTLTAANGVVYTSVENRALALDEATGQVRWSIPVDGSATAPAIGPAAVYFGYGCDLTWAFDFNGHQLWNDTFACVGGQGSVPVYHDGRVYLRQGDPRITNPLPMVVDAGTGRVERTFGGATTPAFIGTEEVDVTPDGYLSASDEATGQVLWFAGDGFLTAAPVIDGDTIFVAAIDSPTATTTIGQLRLYGTRNGDLIDTLDTDGLVYPPNEGGAALGGLAVGGGVVAVATDTAVDVFG